MRDVLSGLPGKPQFAGHETFPLRLLWLKKAFEAAEGGVKSSFFHEPEAVVRFGVGKNMAVSMRYWGVASGMLGEEGKFLHETPLGSAVLSDNGWDPFLEKAATLWLVHWKFASTSLITSTIYFAFNSILPSEFNATSLLEGLKVAVAANEWRASETTLRRDIEVFLRSYVRREDANLEDAAEPLLAELGLVRGPRPGGWYEFARGPKRTLPDAVFAFALNEFWNRDGQGPTSLSAEQICHAPGAPGTVFKLDEDSVITRLMKMEELTEGGWIWTDTAGLRQIQRRKDIKPIKLLAKAYAKQRAGRVAP